MKKFIILFLLLNSALAQTSYFASFDGYNHPIKLSQEIEKETLHHRDGAYYRADYNSKKELITVTKYFKKKEIQKYQYTYRKNGKLLTAKIFRRGKLLSILNYNKSGKLSAISKK